MVTQSTDNSNPEKHFRERETSAQIKQAFEARQSSSSYRDMLVSLVYCISRGVLSYRVQFQRGKLPIAQYRDKIIQTLDASQVLVLSGETGWSVYLNNAIFLP
jgi:ATP-dependent RNA helicase DHX29